MSFVIRASRWRQVVPLIGCLAILMVSLFVVAQRGPSSLAWAVIIASGIGLIGSSSMLLEDSKRLVVDDDGIWSHTWRIGVVPWKDLKDVFVRSDGGQDFICFVVLDHEELRKRLSLCGRVFTDAGRATGYGDLILNATHLRLRANEIVVFASKRIADAKKTEPKAPKPPTLRLYVSGL